VTQLILAGSYFDNGYKIGQTGAEYIKQLLRRDKKLLLSAKKKRRSLLLFLFNKLRTGYGDYLEELRGMALGAGVDFQDLFLENCPEILDKFSGCTSGAVNGPRYRFIIHNEDEDKWRSMKSCALLHYRNRKKNFRYSSFAYFGELAGNAFNWNNNGLFFSVDAVSGRRVDLKSAPRYFEARRLLESKNLKESLSFLRANKSASGFHYLFGEAVSKRIVSVEKYLGQTSVLEIKSGESFCHSNHYIHGLFREKKKEEGRRKKEDGSFYRLKIAQENLTRTHLKNTSARDMSQFPQDQGATTKVCLLHSKEELTPVLRKLAISHTGCGDFLVPLRCDCVAVAQATASLSRLADTRKSLATRAGCIFEMGSNQTSPKEALKTWTMLLRQPLSGKSETKTFTTVLADFRTGKVSVYPAGDKKKKRAVR